MSNLQLAKVAETSPAAASTVAGAAPAQIMIPPTATALTIESELQGATGGTLDVYVQTLIGKTWVDWGHFAQLADGAALVKKMIHFAMGVAVAETVVGSTPNDGTTPAPVLAADTFLGACWGSAFRVVYVAGAGTNTGAAQIIRFVFLVP